jgi:hypothetical protein
MMVCPSSLAIHTDGEPDIASNGYIRFSCNALEIARTITYHNATSQMYNA